MNEYGTKSDRLTIKSKYFSMPVAIMANGIVSAGCISPRIAMQSPRNIRGPTMNETRILVKGETRDSCLK